MALVVWVYAGGGESEVVGLIPFLQQNLPRCTFERKLPIRRKPGPRPDVHIPAYGSTGKSLIDQIKNSISKHWDDAVDIVIVMDDSDDKSPTEREHALQQAIVGSLSARQVDISTGKPIVTVSLAVPEIETWLLADWDSTFAKEFGDCQSAAKHEVSKRGLKFSAPESFEVVDKDGGYRKISEVLQSVLADKCGVRYSKATDTPRLLGLINPTTVSRKCPYFNKFWQVLKPLCGAPSKGARA